VHLTKKIALAAGALTLAAGGVASAIGAPPEAADEGLTTAEEGAGFELPASGNAEQDDVETEAPADEIEDDTDEVTDDAATEGAEEEVEGDGGPEGNHGAMVSAAAQSDEYEGRAHGEHVSSVARQDHGAETSAERSTKSP